MRSITLLSVLVAAALVAASVAGASASPIAPASGAVVGSHPVFSWSLPAGEQSELIAISSSPSTTPEGAFFDENVADLGFFTDASTTTWAPTRPLFAGPYWWNVETVRTSDYSSFYSAPTAFTVGTNLRILGLKIERFFGQAWFTPRWVTNGHQVAVSVRIRRPSGVTVGRLSKGTETLIAQDPDQALLTWTRPRRVKRGAKLVATLTVRSGSAVKTLSKAFRAP